MKKTTISEFEFKERTGVDVSENDVAYFIEYSSGKIDAFEDEESRAAVIAEIEEDNKAFLEA